MVAKDEMIIYFKTQDLEWTYHLNRIFADDMISEEVWNDETWKEKEILMLNNVQFKTDDEFMRMKYMFTDSVIRSKNLVQDNEVGWAKLEDLLSRIDPKGRIVNDDIFMGNTPPTQPERSTNAYTDNQ